jgi:hypothetical protein
VTVSFDIDLNVRTLVFAMGFHKIGPSLTDLISSGCHRGGL